MQTKSYELRNDLDGSDHGGYDTLEEATGAARFDRLTHYSIAHNGMVALSVEPTSVPADCRAALAAVLEAIKPYTRDDEAGRPWLTAAKIALGQTTAQPIVQVRFHPGLRGPQYGILHLGLFYPFGDETTARESLYWFLKNDFSEFTSESSYSLDPVPFAPTIDQITRAHDTPDTGDDEDGEKPEPDTDSLEDRGMTLGSYGG